LTSEKNKLQQKLMDSMNEKSKEIFNLNKMLNEMDSEKSQIQFDLKQENLYINEKLSQSLNDISKLNQRISEYEKKNGIDPTVPRAPTINIETFENPTNNSPSLEQTVENNLVVDDALDVVTEGMSSDSEDDIFQTPMNDLGSFMDDETSTAGVQPRMDSMLLLEKNEDATDDEDSEPESEI
jgi:predicted nuclease with TOPRIM domain